MSDKQEKGGQLAVIDSFKQLVNKKIGSYWTAKAEWMHTEQAAFLERAFIYIAQNKDLLEMANDQDGRASLLMCLETACRLGLQFGGIRPQLHLVAFNTNVGTRDTPRWVKKATLIPTVDGLLSVVLSPPSVIKDCRLIEVFENDSYHFDPTIPRLDFPKGIDPFMDRGAFKGCFVVITENDGRQNIVPVSAAYIEKIKANVTEKNKGKESKFWKEWPEEMRQKTAAKKALRGYIGKKEGLSVILDYEETEPMTQEQADDYKEKPTSERLAQRLVDPVPEEPPVNKESARAIQPEGGEQEDLF